LKPKDFVALLLTTGAAFGVAGYHPGVEDAEIYVPGIKKILNPALYPFGSEFFLSHARMTLFPNLIAASVRWSHLSLDAAMLLWHLLSIFLVLLACRQLANLLFDEPPARWAAVGLVAALLTIPVAGTALYILDEYLNPRSFALFATLFALAETIKKKYWAAGVWIVMAAMIHPLMAVFGVSLAAVVVLLREIGGAGTAPNESRSATGVAAAAFLLPLGFSLRYPSAAYREIIQMRPYFFILRWQWYEWLGIVMPLALLWWFTRLARKHKMPTLALLCRALIIYGVDYFALALVMTIPPRLLALVRYQPMRAFQLLYVMIFLMIGGFLGKWFLRDQVWRWIVLFVPLCAGMFYAQRQLFPATPHIEWPGRVPQNDWLQAFAWIRANTPTDAVFALNPNHMALPGEDQHGFRALAERSMLADAIKDSGALTMFPDLPLAEHWEQQMNAQQGWDHFQAADFARLRRDWGVTWVVLDQPEVTGLACPYSNATLRVCRVE
jgi:hypothetical protein